MARAGADRACAQQRREAKMEKGVNLPGSSGVVPGHAKDDADLDAVIALADMVGYSALSAMPTIWTCSAPRSGVQESKTPAQGDYQDRSSPGGA